MAKSRPVRRQRPGLGRVGLHPQAPQEEGGRRIGPLQDPDDGFIVPRRLATSLAGVEGERHIRLRPVTVGDEGGFDGR